MTTWADEYLLESPAESVAGEDGDEAAETEAAAFVLECEVDFQETHYGFQTARVPKGYPGAGQPFLTMVNGQVCAEGEPVRFAETREEAYRLFRDGWNRLGKTGSTLLWRVLPESECFRGGEDKESERWQVRARFLIV